MSYREFAVIVDGEVVGLFDTKKLAKEVAMTFLDQAEVGVEVKEV